MRLGMGLGLGNLLSGQPLTGFPNDFSFNFDGSNDNLVLDNESGKLLLNNGASGSISVWIYAETLNQTDYEFSNDFFLDNLNLLKYFPNNQNILLKYYDLAKILKYNEWTLFFETLLFQKKDVKQTLNQLNKQSKDYNLKKIIKLYT